MTSTPASIATELGSPSPDSYQLSHLLALEAESIHMIREVAAEFERPVLLFSGGKDSIVMLHLAMKAFRPGRLPFPVMHVDTGHNFDEVVDFRDRVVAETGARLVVAAVQDDIDAGRAVDTGLRNPLQTVTLLRGIAENRFDAAFGGARRDEEKARAKERAFSFRDEFGQWDPKNQRPELWNLYNGRPSQGVNTSGSFPCRIGPSSTSGRTSVLRGSSYRRSTTRIGEKCSSGTGCSWRYTRWWHRTERKSLNGAFGSEPLATSLALAALSRRLAPSTR